MNGGSPTESDWPSLERTDKFGAASGDGAWPTLSPTGGLPLGARNYAFPDNEETEDDVEADDGYNGANGSPDDGSGDESGSDFGAGSSSGNEGGPSGSRASVETGATGGDFAGLFHGGAGGARRGRAYSPLMEAELDPELYGLRRTGRARAAPKRMEVSTFHFGPRESL